MRIFSYILRAYIIVLELICNKFNLTESYHEEFHLRKIPGEIDNKSEVNLQLIELKKSNCKKNKQTLQLILWQIASVNLIEYLPNKKNVSQDKIFTIKTQV